MAVFSEPEQYQVELTNAAQLSSVGEGGGARTELRGVGAHDPSGSGHDRAIR